MCCAIIIPTLGCQPKLLERAINSCLKQAFSSQNVIVVVNAAESELKQLQGRLAPGLATHKLVSWLAMGSNRGFGTAVNAGIKQALAAPQPPDYIALLNDDAWAEPDWLGELVNTAKTTGTDMAASKVLLGDSNQVDSLGFSFAWRGKAEPLKTLAAAGVRSTQNDRWLNHPEWLGALTDSNSRPLTEPFGPDAAACLYSSRLLEQTGGFDERFFAYLEDVDLALRARLLGMQCALAANAVVHHTKHQTSSSRGSRWKAWQDVTGWWRIVAKYPGVVWAQLGWHILVERARNLRGWLA